MMQKDLSPILVGKRHIFLSGSQQFALLDFRWAQCLFLPPKSSGLFPSKLQIWIKYHQKPGSGNNHRSEDLWRERESFTNPSLSPPECCCFDGQAGPSVITGNMEDKQRTWDGLLKIWLQQRNKCVCVWGGGLYAVVTVSGER